ncbi:MAG: hypothetical protein Q8O98_00730 [bacterium]|nr:hypothetical protein [bacterium]
MADLKKRYAMRCPTHITTLDFRYTAILSNGRRKRIEEIDIGAEDKIFRQQFRHTAEILLYEETGLEPDAKKLYSSYAPIKFYTAEA